MRYNWNAEEDLMGAGTGATMLESGFLICSKEHKHTPLLIDPYTNTNYVLYIHILIKLHLR